MESRRNAMLWLVSAVGAIAVAAPMAGAQNAAAPSAAAVARRTGHPQRDTLIKMMTPMTVNFENQRLEDVMDFIRTVTGADLGPMWVTDSETEGLDREMQVTIQADNITALDLIEKLLERASADIGESTWQLSGTGTLELGPKERLNRYKRVEIYDIKDLLFELPEYPQVPLLDLQSVLQSNRGGGGGRSPFRQNQTQQQLQTGQQISKLREEQSQDVMDMLQELVEPDQWVDRGGDGASMRFFQGALIVSAPDYVHRQLMGYPYWPQRATRISMANGRRYVTLSTDNQLATVDGFGQQPVSAVVGGQIIRSNDPPGGGG